MAASCSSASADMSSTPSMLDWCIAYTRSLVTSACCRYNTWKTTRHTDCHLSLNVLMFVFVCTHFYLSLEHQFPHQLEIFLHFLHFPPWLSIILRKHLNILESYSQGGLMRDSNSWLLQNHRTKLATDTQLWLNKTQQTIAGFALCQDQLA